MYTKTVIAAALLQLAQEDHLVAHFLHAHIEIVDAGKRVTHFIELVIMRREECLGARLRKLVQIFRNGPGDAHAIVCRSTATDFIEQY